MVKFLLVTALLLYLMSKFSTQLFRFALWIVGQQLEKEIQKQDAQTNGFQTKDYKDMTLHYKNTTPSNKKMTKEGGDYVDFEEVK
jgi:hypothetical protein